MDGCGIAGSKNTVADALSRIQGVKTDIQEAWSLDLVKRQQDSCPILSQIKSLLVSKETLPKVVDENQDEDLNFYYKKMLNLSVGEDGILRHIATENSETGQIVIPRSLTSRVLQMMHDDLGHFGTAKTSARVRERSLVQKLFAMSEKENPGSCKKSSTSTDCYSPPRGTGRVSIEFPRISLLFGHG